MRCVARPVVGVVRRVDDERRLDGVGLLGLVADRVSEAGVGIVDCDPRMGEPGRLGIARPRLESLVELTPAVVVEPVQIATVAPALVVERDRGWCVAVDGVILGDRTVRVLCQFGQVDLQPSQAAQPVGRMASGLITRFAQLVAKKSVSRSSRSSPPARLFWSWRRAAPSHFPPVPLHSSILSADESNGSAIERTVPGVRLRRACVMIWSGQLQPGRLDSRRARQVRRRGRLLETGARLARQSSWPRRRSRTPRPSCPRRCRSSCPT